MSSNHNNYVLLIKSCIKYLFKFYPKQHLGQCFKRKKSLLRKLVLRWSKNVNGHNFGLAAFFSSKTNREETNFGMYQTDVLIDQL